MFRIDLLYSKKVMLYASKFYLNKFRSGMDFPFFFYQRRFFYLACMHLWRPTDLNYKKTRALPLSLFMQVLGYIRTDHININKGNLYQLRDLVLSCCLRPAEDYRFSTKAAVMDLWRTSDLVLRLLLWTCGGLLILIQDI